MKKKISVILTQNNQKLGNKGNIIKVSAGFAFNYLFPRNLAQKVTKGNLKHANMFLEIHNKQLEANKKQADIIQNHINKINNINLYKKTGDYKQIFGSITDKEIINNLYNITGIQIEKKQIHIPNINTIGSFDIKINIMNTIPINVKINVLAENI